MVYDKLSRRLIKKTCVNACLKLADLFAAILSEPSVGANADRKVEQIQSRGKGAKVRRPASDVPDEHGYVKSPADPTAYVSAAQIRNEHTAGAICRLAPRRRDRACQWRGRILGIVRALN